MRIDGRIAAATVNGRRTGRGGAPTAATRARGEQAVVAPMPGRVVRVLVAAGDAVAARQSVVVVEAMKMENELRSPQAGRVKEVAVTAGASVEAGRVLDGDRIAHRCLLPLCTNPEPTRRTDRATGRAGSRRRQQGGRGGVVWRWGCWRSSWRSLQARSSRSSLSISAASLRARAERDGSKFIQRPMHIGRLSAKLTPGVFVVEDLVIEGLQPTASSVPDGKEDRGGRSRGGPSSTAS